MWTPFVRWSRLGLKGWKGQGPEYWILTRLLSTLYAWWHEKHRPRVPKCSLLFPQWENPVLLEHEIRLPDIWYQVSFCIVCLPELVTYKWLINEKSDHIRETNKTGHPAVIFDIGKTPPRRFCRTKLLFTRSQYPVKEQAANLSQNECPLRITTGSAFPLGWFEETETMCNRA